MKKLKYQISGFFLRIIAVSIILGCSSFGPAKPNDSFTGPYPDKFNQLTYENPLIAKEIGKLPELQDGISDSDAEALEILCDLYAKDPESFDATFKQMYKVGHSEIRKYCTPLQALYWLAEYGKIDELHSQIHNYSLRHLLDSSWNFNWRLELEQLDISEQEAQEIVDTLNEDLNRHPKYQETAKDVVIFVYNWYPHYIRREYRELIENGNNYRIIKAKFDRNKLRWSDFETVIYRLNSPELLDYYERHVIRYKYVGGYGEGIEEVFRVFENKYGHCAQITAFTKYVLQKAGYKAYRRIVIHPALRSPKGNDHRVCCFIVKGKKYIMDNGRGRPFGIVRLEDYDPMIHPYNGNYYKVWNELSED